MRRTALALGLCLFVAAGCGDEGDEPTTTVNQTTTVTETTPAPATTAPPETDTTPAPGPAGCADAAGNEIDVITGAVTCSAAQDTAAQYDAQGERVQEIGEWICEGGNAATRPVIFTCSGPGGEFVVREAGG